MNTSQHIIPNRIESAGVDWCTVTAKSREGQSGLLDIAHAERRYLIEAGYEIETGLRLGYSGWQGRGFFFGTREDSTMAVASGGDANRLFPLLSKAADKITRLDVQVTVALRDAPVDVAGLAYKGLQRGLPCKVPPRSYTYIEQYPHGRTLNVNKRVSDSYARLYDKASEEGVGTPLTRWRYEVELKRDYAKRVATYLNSTHPLEVASSSIVWCWFNARGVAPVWDLMSGSEALSPTRVDDSRDVLRWFEESLSKTVSKAVNRYGLPEVLSSLGLDKHIEDFAAQRRAHTDDTGQPLRLELDDVDSRAELPE